MRKFLLLLLMLMNLSVGPTFAEETVVVERDVSSTNQQLDLRVPTATSPGPGSFKVEIINPDGSLDHVENIEYCKDTSGVIHWREACAELVKIASLEELVKVNDPDQLPAYDPAQEPIKTTERLLVGLAALTLIGVRIEEEKKNDEEKSDTNSESSEAKEKEELASLDSGELGLFVAGVKRGDLSRTWQHKRTHQIDSFFRTKAQSLGMKSILIFRTLADGTYLRAMLGSFSLFHYPVALAFGIYVSIDNRFAALPPVWTLLAGIMALSAFDAFAGVIVATIYFSSSLVSGNILHRSDFMTVLGVSIVMISPALIASAIRPFRRLIASEQVWERLFDYGLITLLTGWTIKNAVLSLNTLAHKQFPVTFYADQIGIIIAFAIFGRLILEDIATHFYPNRIKQITPQKPGQSRAYAFIGQFWHIFIFVLITSRFVGWNLKLAIGTFIFYLPSLFKIAGGRISHRAKFWYWLTPKGAFKIIAMIFIGGFFADLMHQIIKSPKDYIAWSFAFMAIPSFLINLFKMLSKSPESDWKEHLFGRWIYRFGGVAVFILLILMVRGVDLLSWTKSHL